MEGFGLQAPDDRVASRAMKAFTGIVTLAIGLLLLALSLTQGTRVGGAFSRRKDLPINKVHVEGGLKTALYAHR